MKALVSGLLLCGALLAFALSSGLPRAESPVEAASVKNQPTKRALGEGLVPPGTLYSPGVLVGHTIYVAGLQGTDAETRKLPPVFGQEVRNALNNVGVVLKDGGMGYGDVVSVQIFLVDISQFQQVNDIYKEYFKAPLPARTTVQVAKLSLGSRIEISAVGLVLRSLPFSLCGNYHTSPQLAGLIAKIIFALAFGYLQLCAIDTLRHGLLRSGLSSSQLSWFRSVYGRFNYILRDQFIWSPPLGSECGI